MSEPRLRPILFSAPMVLALLAGRKTQTRRIRKTPREPSLRSTRASREAWDPNRCPYGVPGDRLWVKETWAPHADEEETFRNVEAAHRGVGGISEPGHVRPALFYRADGGDPYVARWRPSIHMPRWASRLTLEVTEVRVQRLQEISDLDVLAEGVD